MIRKVYIILVNYNGSEDTIECLESLRLIDYLNYQIIVVDNGSTDDSIQKLVDWAINKTDFFVYTKNEALNGGIQNLENRFKSPIVYIDTKENKGFAAGNNIALKYCFSKNDFNYIWLLNNDTVVEKDSLAKLIEGIERGDNIGAVGSKVLFYDKKNLLQNMGTRIDNHSFFKLCKPIIDLKRDNIDEGQFDFDFEVNDIMGASLLIKKEVIEKIGLMPEEYFLYAEETDWNFNIQKCGYMIMTIHKSKIYHKKSKTTGGDLSPITLYYRTRNQFILNRKYMSLSKYILFAIFFSFKKIITSLRLKRKQRIIVLKGVLDGIRMKSGKQIV